jgi:D-serine deaminase-like pyridoxal phosphate-dependent protein
MFRYKKTDNIMSNRFNRRGFLQTGALAGAAALIPGQLHAEKKIEIASSHIGKSKWDLDSPALCVDLDRLEMNIRTAQTRLKGTGCEVRPHVKTHKCPAIAKMQVAAGAIGVCAAKLSEAEIMFENGIQSVLMTGVNVTVPKIRRAMALRKKYPGFIQAVDNPQNAQDLQDAAKEAGIIADVCVDIDVIKRSGVLTGEPALKLAQQVSKSPNLRFRGILAYDGMGQHIHGFAARRAAAFKTMEPVVESYDMMKKSGLNIEIFSGGGTGTYDIMYEVPGFTDVQAGSYVFMDNQYLAIGSSKNDTVNDDFSPSLTVLTTVINTNYPGRIITDAGSKSFTLNKPNAFVIGEPDFDYMAGSDEYGTITFNKSSKTYKVGDKLEAIIPHCDPAVNLYDFMYGIRKEKVESILPILARGKSQ